MIAGDLARDFYFGGRALRRQPGFTLVAVLTLAIGIGANAAVFTIVDALLWHRLPVRAPNELVLFSDSLFTGTSTGDPPLGTWNLFSSDIYRSFRSAHLPLSGIAATASGSDPAALRLPGRPDRDATPAARARVQLVSGNYFDVMGAAVAAGRTLAPADDAPGAPPAAVVSDRFWRGTLGADPLAVGRVVTLSGTSFTVVGITQPEFFGERVRQAPDVWVPLAFQPQIQQRPSWAAREDAYWLNLIARLAPGASRDSATTAVTATLRQYLAAHSGRGGESARRIIDEARVDLADGSGGLSDARQRYGQPSTILLGIVGLMLLIACANVGNLLLVRATARGGEAALRRALGASRGRLIRQWLAESLLLSSLGAVSGMLIAAWLVRLLLGLFVSRSTPIHAEIDGAVLAFTVGITVTASLLFGLAPALRVSRTDLLTALRGSARGATAHRLRVFGVTEPLVVAQIAISLVVVTGAALLARSLVNLERAPLGFDRGRVLLARINPRLAGYTPAQAVVLYGRLYDELKALPGVEQVTMARYSPFSGSHSVNGTRIDGYEPAANERVQIETVLVGPSYPQALGMAMIGGRAIDVNDRVGRPAVAMVNEAFGRRYAGGASPIGRHVHFGGDRDYEIVGIVGDAHFQSVRDAMTPVIFVPMWQESSLMALDCEIELRTAGDPESLAAPVRRLISSVDSRLAVTSTTTLATQVSETFAVNRLTARFVAAFATVALLLAAIGLYGVVSYGVARRTGEIGLRVALGASRRDVLRLVLGETLVRVAAGVVLGIAAAVAAGRLVASQLFGVGPRDPLTLALAALVLVSVAVATALLPALRATRIDPAVALRAD